MPELSVNRKSIGKLFSEMQERRFVIPDFQRPYSWDIEKCETLWQDITDFLESETNTSSDYFLGTIVSNVNDEGNQDIIDGQQRITTISLMLRAFYRKLELMPQNDDDVKGLKSQLAPCIWDVDPIAQLVKDRSKIHIESRVATEEDNQIFHTILESGEVSEKNPDNYSQNYLYFQKVCDNYAAQNPMNWKKLCITILNRCIVLPIECSSQETALTIFSTLNDRGLPLDDSDIFKAQIYRTLQSKEQRNEFTEKWRELSQTCTSAGITVNDIFRYYSHVIRARNEDNSKEVGLRKFYATNKYEALKNSSLMDDLIKLARFWYYLYCGFNPENEDGYSISHEAEKFIHCLYYYPNEYWKYPVSVYFLRNCDDDNFEEDFCHVLKKITAFMFAKFLSAPTVNAIKSDVFAACIAIYRREAFWTEINFEISGDNFYASLKLSRAMLLLHAYLNPNQTDFVPAKFDIEHIFPRSWQNTNYNGWDFEQAKKYLDWFGNKVVFEKKLNIQAGNGYFGRKKEKYLKSVIADVLELGNYAYNDFAKDDIEEREKAFKARLLNFFHEQLHLGVIDKEIEYSGTFR